MLTNSCFTFSCLYMHTMISSRIYLFANSCLTGSPDFAMTFPQMPLTLTLIILQLRDDIHQKWKPHTEHTLAHLCVCIIKHVLMYYSACFCTMLPATNRNKLFKVTVIASKMISLTILNKRSVIQGELVISQDGQHPLNPCFIQLLPDCWYKTLTWKTDLFSGYASFLF